MTVLRSILLYLVAALAEIGGAWLIWEGVRERRGLVWVGAGVVALGLYGLVATLQTDAHFGRVLAAYGGVFVAGSLAWGVLSTSSARTASTSPERCSASSAWRSSCMRRAEALSERGLVDFQGGRARSKVSWWHL